MARLVCCKLTDKHYSLIRYTIITWTSILATTLFVSAVFSDMVAYEWIELTMSKVNFTRVHPVMRRVDNSQSNSSFYEYDSIANKQYETSLNSQSLRDSYQRALSIVVIINCVIGGLFHVFGLVGAWRCVHCLVLTFAIYMTFASVMLFINSLTTSYYALIPAILALSVTFLSFTLCSGIRERWFRAVGVAAIGNANDDPDSHTSVTSDECGTDRTNQLYPDLSNYDIFRIHTPINNDVQHYPAIPTAPPLPPFSQTPEFSKI